MIASGLKMAQYPTVPCEVKKLQFNKFKMQSTVLLCFAALVACACAEVYVPEGYAEEYPEFYHPVRSVRHPRDLSWGTNVGGGRVFGTLGSTDDSLFGRGGYKHDIFDDRRGHLQGQAYGARVLGAGGDSSLLGGKLDWSNPNDNVRASLDVYKDIGRGSGMRATGEGVWKLDHNTRLVGGANVQKTFGHHRPEGGLEARIEHDF